MAKEYKVGEKYYLPVKVFTTDARSSVNPIGIEYVYTGNGRKGAMYLDAEPDILLTAEDIAMVINTERDDALEELKASIRELEVECEKWKATAQNCENSAKAADNAADGLRLENKKLKAKVAENADTISRLSANKVALTEEVGRLRETIADRTKDVQNLTAENDKLGTERDQRNKDILAMKKDRDTLLAENKKLKDGADKLKDTLVDRTKDVQHLTEENDKLTKRNKYLESEKNRKPIVHVLTNDGHVYAFTSSGKVHVKYCTEHNILMIEDGEKTIAGFSRGDKPGNLSAWWMG